jgi:hypothetical protein
VVIDHPPIACSRRPLAGAAASAALGGVQYTVSRHWANLRESAEFPTNVKEVVTLLCKPSQAISNRLCRNFHLRPFEV